MTDRRDRCWALFALALLIGWLMAPNALWLWFSAQTRGIPVGTLGLAACLTLLWFALFGRRLWLGCLLLAPFAALVPGELYYIARYHVPSSVDVLGTLVATDVAETHQYVGGALVPLALACAAGMGVALLAAWRIRHSRLQWVGRLRVAAACLSTLFILALPLLFGPAAKHSPSGRIAGALVASHDEFGRLMLWTAPGYPFGVPVRVGQFIGYRHMMKSAAASFAGFHFGAHLATPLPSRQVYVLVIGESSRRDHWQLFGYDRPTTPELVSLPNLVPIRHMVSAFAQTESALPVMLTRKPAQWPASATWPEPSIVRAMQEAGFQTWWISDQYAMGPYDSAVAVFANEADHLEWLNHADWNAAHGGVDGDLVPALAKALRDTHGNLFVVLHMLGSHDYYDFRYPPAFAHFKPTESDRTSPVPHWQRVTNSYDNTILYTDHVLAQIIDTLKQNGATSALWYASDHSETLPSPTCHDSAHANENRPEYQIPALFWYSDAYAKAFPARVATIRAHADERSMSQDTFPTLIDMAGVDLPGHSMHEAWSLFSPQWRFHTRWVNQFWQVDFDHARTTGACMRLLPESSPGGAASGGANVPLGR